MKRFNADLLLISGYFAAVFGALLLFLAFPIYANGNQDTPPNDGDVRYWTYPSGFVMPHPVLPIHLCVLARGHPARPDELHCAPLPSRPKPKLKPTDKSI